MIVRLQDGFTDQFDAISAAENYIDGIMGGTIIDIDEGDGEIIGLDIIPEAPDLSELRPDNLDIPRNGGGSNGSSVIDLKANQKYPYAYIGLGVIVLVVAMNRK